MDRPGGKGPAHHQYDKTTTPGGGQLCHRAGNSFFAIAKKHSALHPSPVLPGVEAGRTGGNRLKPKCQNIGLTSSLFGFCVFILRNLVTLMVVFAVVSDAVMWLFSTLYSQLCFSLRPGRLCDACCVLVKSDLDPLSFFAQRNSHTATQNGKRHCSVNTFAVTSQTDGNGPRSLTIKTTINDVLPSQPKGGADRWFDRDV